MDRPSCAVRAAHPWYRRCALFVGVQEALMSIRGFARVTCAGILLACVLAGAASAQVSDKRTTFTLKNPTSVPGVTLPPGDYQFRLADAASRDVVQVLSADGTTVYAMFFTIPVWRARPAGDSELHFMET